MTFHREHVRLFKTLPHACGYYTGRTAQNIVIDPTAPSLPDVYSASLASGFRRAGGHIYRPNCPRCHACEPCRIDVAAFRPDRSQRRCSARNRDLTLQPRAPGLTAERYDLYARYLHARHRGGGMDDTGSGDFEHFLSAPWSPTTFLEFRLGGRLLAVAVTDVCPTGLSAVYTFYEPTLPKRSLGTYAILSQVRLAHEQGLPFVYLGYWIENHPKMGYKARFSATTVLGPAGWHALHEGAPRT